MNALARYLLVFLLGWSGAVYSYSDLIYPKKNAPLNSTHSEQKALLGQEIKETLTQTKDISSNKGLKLPATASDRFTNEKKTSKKPDS